MAKRLLYRHATFNFEWRSIICMCLKMLMTRPDTCSQMVSISYHYMNLPPDKLSLLSQYDNDKKWELICDQERFQVKNPPSTYLTKIKSFYQDQGGVTRRFKRRVQESTQVLRELEISLRTNHIGWAQEFLNEENQGLDVLVDYLSYAQCEASFDLEGAENGGTLSERGKPAERSMEDLNKSAGSSPTHGMTRAARALTWDLLTSDHHLFHPLLCRITSLAQSRRTQKISRLASQRDDVHVCIMCLRAIMNYQSGFNQVMTHPRCVNEITLSLNNKNPRTKALVLELLAAVCLVRGGHDIILAAFDNLKEVSGEKNRFENLMEYFSNDDSNIDFMVACMQFINIVVHSVENMNFRVHLQYEFTHHGLDQYLESLKLTESEKLQVQIQAYLDNVFDVGALLEDAENRGGVNYSMTKIILCCVGMLCRVVSCRVMSCVVLCHVSCCELNMEAFEEQFKTKAQGPPAALSTLKVKVAQKAPSKVNLIEGNKAKNLAITLRKGGRSPADICTAIETYDQQALGLDFLELLERFVPSDYELKLLQNYEKEGRPLDDLAEEDRFMMRFGKIPRLAQRISTLTFMGNFPESVKRLQPQLNSIITASMSIKSSAKLKKMLEIILAFGNYMNSSKRGAAYGFRLQSLDLLLDTKSTDRSQTLLHFISSIVQEKYPELNNFHTELRFVDKAGLVSLDSILQDIRSLERGMEVTKKEFLVQEDNTVLKDFVKTNSELLDSLLKDSKTAQETYGSVVEYFGENPKTTQPSMFFPPFVRFMKAYKQAEKDNEQRKRLEAQSSEKQAESPSPKKKEATGHKVGQ
uniref:Formin like 1 n=1 Tax=Hucho hucho TaxID=62062 RepID=A0A4W5PHX6_9TELE